MTGARRRRDAANRSQQSAAAVLHYERKANAEAIRERLADRLQRRAVAPSPPAAADGRAQAPPAVADGTEAPPAVAVNTKSPPAAADGRAQAPPATADGTEAPPAVAVNTKSPPATTAAVNTKSPPATTAAVNTKSPPATTAAVNTKSPPVAANNGGIPILREFAFAAKKLEKAKAIAKQLAEVLTSLPILMVEKREDLEAVKLLRIEYMFDGFVGVKATEEDLRKSAAEFGLNVVEFD